MSCMWYRCGKCDKEGHCEDQEKYEESQNEQRKNTKRV